MVARGCYTLQQMPGAPASSVHVVIYDGECLFCRRCVRLLRALDRRGALALVDGNDAAAVGAAAPALQAAALPDALHVVAPDGTVSSGFLACRRLAHVLPLLWPLLPLLHAPGAGLAGPRLYALVARNRRRLGCRP